MQYHFSNLRKLFVTFLLIGLFAFLLPCEGGILVSCSAGYVIWGIIILSIFIGTSICSTLLALYYKRDNKKITWLHYVLSLLIVVSLPSLFTRTITPYRQLQIISQYYLDEWKTCQKSDGEHVFFKDGKKVVRNCNNGKWDGLTKEYDEKGDITRYSYFVNGSMYGFRTDFSYGDIESVTYFLTSEIHDGWRKSESRQSIYFYNRYNANSIYSGTEAKMQNYYCKLEDTVPSPEKVEKCTPDGLYDGNVTKFFPKKNVKGEALDEQYLGYEEYYRNGVLDGTLKVFDQDENLQLEAIYVAGRLNGKVKLYYQGALKHEMNFVDALPVLADL